EAADVMLDVGHDGDFLGCHGVSTDAMVATATVLIFPLAPDDRQANTSDGDSMLRRKHIQITVVLWYPRSLKTERQPSDLHFDQVRERQPNCLQKLSMIVISRDGMLSVTSP
ncbi:hypothetical protein U0070_006479, partial [Myodes glareolus]